MSDYCYDNRYSGVAKPTASYTKIAKATASYSGFAKPSVSYAVVEEPCYALLSLLTEHGIEILYEDSRRIVREG